MLYALSAFATALCLVVLPWTLYVIAQAVIDAHHRGMARVHSGSSWSKRSTRSDEQAAA